MAKKLEIQVPHRHSRDDALARMQALGDYYKNKHNAAVSWDGYNGHVKAKYLTITADIGYHVGEKEVRLDGPDPGMLLRGKITSYLKGKLETYLDASTPLDKLPRR